MTQERLAGDIRELRREVHSLKNVIVDLTKILVEIERDRKVELSVTGVPAECLLKNCKAPEHSPSCSKY